jgi:hypothetical protein
MTRKVEGGSVREAVLTKLTALNQLQPIRPVSGRQAGSRLLA